MYREDDPFLDELRLVCLDLPEAAARGRDHVMAY
jgi:hypothetical protein